jgi:hypothetical protein
MVSDAGFMSGTAQPARCATDSLRSAGHPRVPKRGTPGGGSPERANDAQEAGYTVWTRPSIRYRAGAPGNRAGRRLDPPHARASAAGDPRVCRSDLQSPPAPPVLRDRPPADSGLSNRVARRVGQPERTQTGDQLMRIVASPPVRGSALGFLAREDPFPIGMADRAACRTRESPAPPGPKVLSTPGQFLLGGGKRHIIGRTLAAAGHSW